MFLASSGVWNIVAIATNSVSFSIGISREIPVDAISEEDQVILSIMDNIRRILNSRAGTLKHLPDYGLPDMSKIIQGLPGSSHKPQGNWWS